MWRLQVDADMAVELGRDKVEEKPFIPLESKQVTEGGLLPFKLIPKLWKCDPAGDVKPRMLQTPEHRALPAAASEVTSLCLALQPMDGDDNAVLGCG